MNSTPNSPTSVEKERPANGASSSRRHGRTKMFWLVVGVAALIGLSVGAVVLKKGYGRFKQSRGAQNAVEAESAIRDGKYDVAAEKVRRALALAPLVPEVQRAAAHLCSVRMDPAGINYYQMVINSPIGTLADKTNMLQLAHATKRLQPARDLLRQMLSADSNDVLAIQYLVQNHVLAEDHDRAVKAAAFGFQLDPTNAWFQLNLGSLLIDDPRGTKYQDQGRRLLFSLAISSKPERIEAQNRIARAQDLTKAEMSVLQKQIEGRTNRTIEDEILIYDLRRRQVSGAQVTALVQEALTRYLRDDPELGLASAMGWAIEGKQAAIVVTTVPAAMAQTNRAVAPLYAHALAGAEKWSELDKFLNASETAIGKALTAGFRGRLAMAQGNRTEAESQFRNLGTSVDISVLDARILAQQAEAAGMPSVAVEIYQKIAKDPASAVEAARDCIRLLSQLEDITQLRDVATQVARIFPQYDMVAWEAAWANLVLGQNIPESWTTMSRLFEKMPSNAIFRYGMAYGELKMGRATEALGRIQDPSVPAFKTMGTRLQTVHVLILAANGQRENAKRLIPQIELARMRPAERNLLKDLL